MNTVVDDIPVLRQPFYFVRHGETQSNADKTIAGWLDVPLSARGRAQANAAAAALPGRGITAIYVSALRRARETAECIASVLALPVNVIHELNERSWGELEGKPRALRVPGVTPAGGETPDVFRQRVLSGLGKIAGDGLPLIVAHSGVFRVLCAVLQVAEPGGQVANAQPVHFLPPSRAGEAWRLSVIA
jgi:2,3-bisphosphoglycerate-dependent phosphoglycerate mutase